MEDWLIWVRTHCLHRLQCAGDREGALTAFSRLDHFCPTTYNPADYFIETLAITSSDFAASKKRVNRICDFFERSQEYRNILADVRESLTDPPHFHHPANPVAQLCMRPTQNYRFSYTIIMTFQISLF
jgi:hypothetical protein